MATFCEILTVPPLLDQLSPSDYLFFAQFSIMGLYDLIYDENGKLDKFYEYLSYFDVILQFFATDFLSLSPISFFILH